METVLAALVIIFIVLFAVLTLSQALLDSQDVLQVSWEEASNRQLDQTRTNIIGTSTLTHNNGAQVEFTLTNSGSIKLADYKDWDFIVQYYDTNTPSTYHINHLDYAESSPTTNEWTVKGIYVDAENDIAEAFEPKVFNPSEELVIQAQLSPSIAAGTYVQLVVVPPNGVNTSTIFRRNTPPVLATNLAIRVNYNESVVVSPAQLETTDVDEHDTPDGLDYTITLSPLHGTLTPDVTFTQADINDGDLIYTHTGTDTSDSFQFTITDGEDVIGAYIATITVNMPPSLDTNTGLTLTSGGAGALGDLLLSTSDADDTAADLIYTVTQLPLQGNLSKNIFTQDDINNALVSYQHTGVGSDSFQFTITDGEAEIGPFTFTISVN